MFKPRGLDSKSQHAAARARTASTSEANPRLSDQLAQWSFEGGITSYTNYYEARIALNTNPLLDSPFTFGLGRGDHGIASSANFMNCPPVTGGYSDPSYVFPTSTDNLLAPSDAFNYVSAPSPAGSGTSSGSMSGHETLERHPCLEYETPPSKDTHRPFPGRGKAPNSMYSAAPHLRHNTETAFRPTPEWPVPQLQHDTHWGTAPSYLPYISQKNRGGVPQISPYPQYNVVERLPTAEELRNWPQVFNNLKGTTVAKKPTLACHFCRCIRPGEEEADQTCNQCVRRKRVCVYPLESRRGQHARRRRSDKPSTPPPTQPRPAEGVRP
ncbi:hypothetical protein B0H16DRAFT_1580240 [Mycena metata]|uniref:Uncharacterized protein n=1 Tax=Mycena metata TaxID=1033252 RepID=A0AAD7MUW2_9AGAR|nr:hypothetical protein B0H16DRAFT_1580240 [Mycena metata]